MHVRRKEGEDKSTGVAAMVSDEMKKKEKTLERNLCDIY